MKALPQGSKGHCNMFDVSGEISPVVRSGRLLIGGQWCEADTLRRIALDRISAR